MKTGINTLLIKVDGQFLERDGIAISDFSDESKHTAVTGTVLFVPVSLSPEVAIDEYGVHGPISPGAPDKALVAELSDGVVDSKCFIWEGDRVMFRFPALMQAQADGLFLSNNEVFISYGHVVGWWLEGRFVTANDYLLVEPEESDDSIRNGIIDVSASDEKVGVGVVKYNRFAHLDVGRKVLYDKTAVSPEVGIHAMLDSDRPLLRVKNSEVMASMV